MKLFTGGAEPVYPEFRIYRHGRCKIWLNPTYADPKFIALLRNPNAFFDFPTCQIIKDQRKIKVGRVVVDVGGEKHAIYVKRYNSVGLRHRVGSMFAGSGGVKSLLGAAILRHNNIATANPIASVEERLQGMVRTSFYLTQEITGGVTIDDYWLNILKPARHRQGFRRRRLFLYTLGELFRTLHNRGVYHNDLKDANILAVPAGNADSIDLYLLDLEGVRQYSALSESRRNKNLVQLNRTLGRHLEATQKLVVLRAYLGQGFFDRRLRRRLIFKVLAESNRLNTVKALLVTRSASGSCS